eukprot:9874595-Lingulodinium_polyedra.AAC.1
MGVPGGLEEHCQQHAVSRDPQDIWRRGRQEALAGGGESRHGPGTGAVLLRGARGHGGVDEED